MGATNQERITGFPQATSLDNGDILYIVQGYVSPTNPGLSAYATLNQVTTFAQNTVVTSFAGDPNGNVAGNTYQLCWDTAAQVLYICTVTGTATTAVWSPVSTVNPGFPWTEVTGTAQTITVNNGYTANNPAQVVFTMPLTAQVGDRIEIQGLGAGGWRINSGNYQLRVGTVASTPATGYIESTNRYDSLVLVCAQANTVFTAVGGPQGQVNII